MSDRLNDPRADGALQTAARAVARSARLAVFTGAASARSPASRPSASREPETGLWSRYAAQQLSASCDVMLIVGTSGVVYPAAAIPMIAGEPGATISDVNPQRDALSRMSDVFLEGPGGEVLPQLVAAVREHLEG